MPRREPIQIEDNLWVVEGTKGYFAYVDNKFFEECRHHTGLVAVPSDYSWSAHHTGRNGRFDGLQAEVRYQGILLHSLLSGYTETDHIDGRPYNDVISNLRDGTNKINSHAFRTATGSSDFLGVSWSKRDKKWQSHIRVKSHYTHLYWGDDEVEAARAYDRKVIELGWPAERLNFPLSEYQCASK